MHNLLQRHLAFLALCLALWAQAASASPSRLCDDAARIASEQTGVPLSILRAITLAETGHTSAGTAGFVAWPWAVQADMRGHWFPDQQSAIAYANTLVGQGKSNIDIGCFQLNMHWHATAFQSVDDMFSPENNALYAATFLERLYQQTGDWRAAVGRYHSRDASRAESYVQRLETLFEQHLARPATAAPAPQAQAKPAAVSQRFGLVLARGPLIQAARNARPLIGGSP